MALVIAAASPSQDKGLVAGEPKVDRDRRLFVLPDMLDEFVLLFVVLLVIFGFATALRYVVVPVLELLPLFPFDLSSSHM